MDPASWVILAEFALANLVGNLAYRRICGTPDRGEAIGLAFGGGIVFAGIALVAACD